MPSAPKRHEPVQAKRTEAAYERWRGTRTTRGYSAEWARSSLRHLRTMISLEADPYCRYCKRNLATMIDHLMPPSRHAEPGTPEYVTRFNDRRNWIPCCLSCNNRKGDKLPSELTGELGKAVKAVAAAVTGSVG